MTAILPCAPGCCSSGIEVEEGCDCGAGGSETFSSVPLTVDTLSVESLESPVAADSVIQMIIKQFYFIVTVVPICKDDKSDLLCSSSLLQDI